MTTASKTNRSRSIPALVGSIAPRTPQERCALRLLGPTRTLSDLRPRGWHTLKKYQIVSYTIYTNLMCAKRTLIHPRAVFPNLKTFGVALCVLTTMFLVEAQVPPLSASFVSPDILQFSWPSNFTTANWQLVSTTNVASGIWQPVPLAPFPSSNALVVSFPINDARRYFRLQKIGAGSCVFQATPQVINSGDSSTLTWCPLAGYTYRISPGPGPGGGAGGVVTGGSLTVSPTNTTVYTLTASNALGVAGQDTTTVICNPCGWLQVTNLIGELSITYDFSLSTASYNFNINQFGSITFHLQLASSTDTDAYFFGFATADPVYGVVLDKGFIQDREDDKTGPNVFTTTEVSGLTPVRLDVSILMLHLTCTTFDFSYNVLEDTTEVTAFGTYNLVDGLATGGMAPRAIYGLGLYNRISGYADIPAAYPPINGDYFTPSSDVGEDLFTTGTATAPNAGQALVTWSFYPEP